jgi:hypothetical protein
MSEYRIPNKVLNMKLKRKCPSQKLRPRWKQKETCFTKYGGIREETEDREPWEERQVQRLHCRKTHIKV